MKIDAVIWKETRYVAVGTLFFTAIEQLAFMAFRKWGISVLLGAILGGGAAVLNFFFLGLTVQKALASGDGELGKQIMKLSRTVRTLALLAILALGVLLKPFSTVAVLVSVFFPRLTLVVRGAVLARRGELTVIPSADSQTEQEETSNEDENS